MAGYIPASDVTSYLKPYNPMNNVASNTEPLVSVCIITYNHERYIGQCLEGVLMQETNFRFQVVIGEDCSTDNTRQVVEAYAARYPDIIIPVYQQQNVGPRRNAYEFCWPLLKGKYIAVCEGDDYWTDPFKLQKQVDFLEKNSDFVLCFHPVATVNENDSLIKQEEATDQVSVFDWKSIFQQPVATLSVVFRNCLPAVHEDFYHAEYGDIFLFSTLSRYGKLADLGFVGGRYRKHTAGMYGGRTMAEKYKGTIATRKLMMRSSLFSEAQKKEIEKVLSLEKKRYIKNLIKHGEFADSLKLLFL
jgi:glycosyltransferase involved in cell wall biosynthesis